ncbi:MAG: efflux RND transporter periplasmic adaptor subunit [Suilimivivens sp.]
MGKESKQEELGDKKKGKKKKSLILLGSLFVLVLAAGIFIILLIKHNNGETNLNVPPVMENMGENVISASGLTEVGMAEEIWEMDFLETPLYVEESYLSVGDEVEAGTAVFKVSTETLEEARQELENAVTEAELNYRQGLIDYETGMIEARVTNETAIVSKKYSQAEYDNAVATVAETVESLREQVEEAEELVEEYTKSVNEDYYRTYYKVDELYQAYYDHFNLLMETYEKWDIENLEDTQAGSSASSSMGGSDTGSMQTGGLGSMSGNAGGNSQTAGNSLLSVYNMLDEVVQEEAEKYETALENYETAKRKAEAGLAQAQSNLESLKAELVTAQTEYEKQLIICKADYEITIAESDNAEAVYETTKESLEETLESLKDEKEEAEENLALFEKVIGDGCFYTQKAGTIVMNGVRAENYLSGETLVVAYSDPETVCVSASVDQSDIADISIGDSVLAVISEYGNYQGKVSLINPVTQAQSRSSVTYQVTITLEGDVSALDSNLTAYVYFGMTEEMMQSVNEMPGAEKDEQRQGAEGGKQRENMPGAVENGQEGERQ